MIEDEYNIEDRSTIINEAPYYRIEFDWVGEPHPEKGWIDGVQQTQTVLGPIEPEPDFVFAKLDDKENDRAYSRLGSFFERHYSKIGDMEGVFTVRIEKPDENAEWIIYWFEDKLD